MKLEQYSNMDFSKLSNTAISYALVNGLLHGEIVDGKQFHVHMPISLLPFPISKANNSKGELLNTLFGELVIKICNKPEWIFNQLKDIEDDFTCHLIDIARCAISCTTYQPLIMGLMRSDYMVENDVPSDTVNLYQIELNTISCSFLGVEEKLSALHQYLLSSSISDIDSISEFLNISSDDINNYIQTYDFNHTAQETCLCFSKAVDIYNNEYHTSNTSILIVNQENENNNIDQFILSLILSQSYHITCIYQTHTELATSMTVSDGILRVDGREIAVVYYRSGYTPTDYPTEIQWDVRCSLECSHAIKCPNILLHLIGCKKIQQQLCLPGVVEDLFGDVQKSAVIRSCFADMYPADAVVRGDVKDVMDDVCQHPLRYVLKPQREGGGYNIWGDEIVHTLKNAKMSELSSLILMRRIFPRETVACHIRDSKISILPSLSEIGFYSGIIFDAKSMKDLYSKNLGILVRTKTSDSFEGGVCAGFAVLNSPIISST